MTTQAQRQGQGWQFWGSWALGFLGFPLGGLAAQALTGGIASAAAGLLGGAATGAVIGTIQWLVLRRRLALSPWWIVATSAGMALGLGASIALFGTDTTGNELLMRGLLTGGAIGSAQAFLLRPWGSRALAWAPLVAIAWPLGWAITRAVGVDLSPNWSVFGSTGAWAFQLLTGLALAWLMRDSER